MEREMRKPTSAEIRLATRAEQAVVNELRLLEAEGIERTLLLAGAGMAIATLIAEAHGAQAVAPWFRAQADMVAKAAGP